MLVKKLLQMTGSLGLAVLLLGVLVLSLGVNERTTILSDTELASIEGGACNMDCNDQIKLAECIEELNLCEAREGFPHTQYDEEPAFECGPLLEDECVNDEQRICATLYSFDDAACTQNKTKIGQETKLGCAGLIP